MNESGNRPDGTTGAGGPSRSGDARAAWVSSVGNWRLVGFSAVLSAGLAIWLWQSVGPGVIALVALPPLVAAVSSVRVVAGRTGVRVGLGPWGWPAVTVRCEDIESAAAEEISAAQVGGWGYRKRPGMTAVLVRGGECLVLRLCNGNRVAVSVPDAQNGAALVNSYLLHAR